MYQCKFHSYKKVVCNNTCLGFLYRWAVRSVVFVLYIYLCTLSYLIGFNTLLFK